MKTKTRMLNSAKIFIVLCVIFSSTLVNTASSYPATSADGFKTVDGKIFDPAGKEFIPIGLNDYSPNLSPSSFIGKSDTYKRWGFNFMRLALCTTSYPIPGWCVDDTSSSNPNTVLKQMVDEYTSKGIVVMLTSFDKLACQNFSGNNRNNMLTQQREWAKVFKGNPYVWINTANEFDHTDEQTWLSFQKDAINNIHSVDPNMVVVADGSDCSSEGIHLPGTKVENTFFYKNAKTLNSLSNNHFVMSYHSYLLGEYEAPQTAAIDRTVKFINTVRTQGAPVMFSEVPFPKDTSCGDGAAKAERVSKVVTEVVKQVRVGVLAWAPSHDFNAFHELCQHEIIANNAWQNINGSGTTRPTNLNLGGYRLWDLAHDANYASGTGTVTPTTKPTPTPTTELTTTKPTPTTQTTTSTTKVNPAPNKGRTLKITISQSKITAKNLAGMIHFESDGSLMFMANTNPGGGGIPAPTTSVVVDPGNNDSRNVQLEAFRRNDAALAKDASTPESGINPMNYLSPLNRSYGGGDGAFRTECRYSHLLYDDPIVYPGRSGAAHLHMFFGNTGVNANTVASRSVTGKNSLYNSGSSTCFGGPLNRTGYWVPALFDDQNNIRVPEVFQVYYKSEVSDGTKTKEFPEGFGMVGARHYWSCTDGVNGADQGYSDSIPNCNSSYLHAAIVFPMCWDGKTLIGAEGKAHVFDPGNVSNVNCPSNFPIQLPEVRYKIYWKIDRASNSNWYVSADRHGGANFKAGASLHGDWLGGWNAKIQTQFVKACINRETSCDTGFVGDGDAFLNSAIGQPSGTTYRLSFPIGYNGVDKLIIPSNLGP